MTRETFTAQIAPVDGLDIVREAGHLVTETFGPRSFDRAMADPRGVDVRFGHRGHVVGHCIDIRRAHRPGRELDWFEASWNLDPSLTPALAAAVADYCALERAVSVGYTGASVVRGGIENVCVELDHIALVRPGYRAMIRGAAIVARSPYVEDVAVPLHWELLTRRERDYVLELRGEGLPFDVINAAIADIPGIAERTPRAAALARSDERDIAETLARDPHARTFMPKRGGVPLPIPGR